MKRVEELQSINVDMSSEYYTNHRKVTREINKLFNDEITHFKELLIAFNDEYKCLEKSEIETNVEKIKEIFNCSRVVLVNDYDKSFTNNVEELVDCMYEFYLKKLTNPNTRCPSKEISNRLKAICKFDYFDIENKLEDSLINFASEFGYKYINSSSAHSDFYRIIKTIKYTLICDLKKIISSSIDDKENITSRYNTEYKRIIAKKDNGLLK